MRIDVRRRLDDDRATIAAGMRRPDDPLPPGPTVNLDFNNAPIQSLIALLTKAGGVNMVMPDAINARVTIYGNDLPWDDALRSILRTVGLGYTYRPNGKIVRIDAQRMLDDEAHRPR
jgi:type IV pilus assembly protein PilQ